MKANNFRQKNSTEKPQTFLESSMHQLSKYAFYILQATCLCFFIESAPEWWIGIDLPTTSASSRETQNSGNRHRLTFWLFFGNRKKPVSNTFVETIKKKFEIMKTAPTDVRHLFIFLQQWRLFEQKNFCTTLLTRYRFAEVGMSLWCRTFESEKLVWLSLS